MAARKTLVFTREICYNTDATHTVSGASYLYAAAFLHVLFVSIIVISRLPLDGVIPAVCVATAAILAEGVFYGYSMLLPEMRQGI